MSNITKAGLFNIANLKIIHFNFQMHKSLLEDPSTFYREQKTVNSVKLCPYLYF